MTRDILFRGNVILPDRIISSGAVLAREDRIVAVGDVETVTAGAGPNATTIDAGDGFVSPGFVDVHVHGGLGADFMDGTELAYATVLKCHARHGTTSIVPTTTVARHDQIMAVLELTRQFRQRKDGAGARVLGAHFYGPYFRYEARGAHPGGPIRPP